jgi:regulator of sirC expression with transglutaminase-like and TPR domain/S1-C subfamily serine protease
LLAAEAAKPAEAPAKPVEQAAEKKADTKPDPAKELLKQPTDWVEKLFQKARNSVVVITVTGRDGKKEGLGSGFIVGADGLIATNLHVIGEGRPVNVRMADGKRYDVKTVEATERSLDLALIRIDAKGLPTLELGDSDRTRQGQPVVALGNPRGLEHSVVAGVISGSREINGLPMIQLAIPIEPGNSGGPLLDEQGRVLGLLTMKSQVTENLGFAVKINSLKPLLKKPNPIPMSRWLTIGALDAHDWQPLGGARWRQRAGRIMVEGAGEGFGGRSLCLSQLPVPEPSYELSVTVKLEDESGAAGLAFASDGGDRHYGFYPTAGRLRLTRFDGPDVLSWHVLTELATEHYKPGDWNTIKVRVEADKITCWLNGKQVIESADAGLRGGKVGLAKFRNTEAHFKDFRLGKELKSTELSADVAAKIEKAIATLPPKGEIDPAVIDRLAKESGDSISTLRDRAQTLEQQAKQLRRLAETVHRREVEAELLKALSAKEAEIDLLRAALLVSKLDNDELDIDAYVDDVDRMARELKEKLAKQGGDKSLDDRAKLQALGTYLFEENGYHGSRNDYYNRSNSYLNEVLDDREGLPITLSVLYMELARRLGLNVVGVGLPGQFMVRYEPAKGEPQVINPYEGGEFLSREEVATKVLAIAEEKLLDEHLATVTKRSIISRMLHNLLSVARRENDSAGAIHYLDAIVAVSPDSAQERLMRAVIHYQLGQPKQALIDTAWILDHQPEGIDIDRVLELHRTLERAADGMK